MNKTNRVMVDMSATLIHHGHIRLIKQAMQLGNVVIGLTTDDEILRHKGYVPEILFKNRKEVLESIDGVYEVVAVPWIITNEVLLEHDIDKLIHGDDNSNPISKDKLVVVDRTYGISSSDIRINAVRAIIDKKNNKLMLTPGPAAILHENILPLGPLFGRGDKEYTDISSAVLGWVQQLSGQDEVVMAQGSATFALELASHTFVRGRVLIILTGYYSDRLQKLLPPGCEVSTCGYDEISSLNEKFDWVLCAYTETSTGFLLDIKSVRDFADQCDAKLFVDATGSIGLEDDHSVADVMAFSSCKGLFGLTGACFVAHKSGLLEYETDRFYFNLNTHRNKMVTGPYHAIASLFGVMDIHETLRQRVVASKKFVATKWGDLIPIKDNQPLLCTYLEGSVVANDESVVLYKPRSALKGSIVCHFGEIHSDIINIENRITIEGLN